MFHSILSKPHVISRYREILINNKAHAAMLSDVQTEYAKANQTNVIGKKIKKNEHIYRQTLYSRSVTLYSQHDNNDK